MAELVYSGTAVVVYDVFEHDTFVLFSLPHTQVVAIQCDCNVPWSLCFRAAKSAVKYMNIL